MLSLLKKYILPKEVDFISGLQKQAVVVDQIITAMHNCFMHGGSEAECQTILDDEYKAQIIRKKNMNDLLNTFITPIDRESIYRVIFQLDWIAVSIRHFILEAKAYNIKTLEQGYLEIIQELRAGSEALKNGFQNLASADAATVASDAQHVRDAYEHVIERYIKEMAILSNNKNLKTIFTQRELLGQLKEIGKRLQVCANNLEDIVIKMS